MGMIPLIGAKVVTEITALKFLRALMLTMFSQAGSEGTVNLVVEGKKEAMTKTIEIYESSKGESAYNFRKGICEIRAQSSPVQPKDYDASAFPKFCRFQEMKEGSLPEYLQNR